MKVAFKYQLIAVIAALGMMASPASGQSIFGTITSLNAVAFERPLLRCLDIRCLSFRDIGVHKTAGIKPPMPNRKSSSTAAQLMQFD